MNNTLLIVILIIVGVLALVGVGWLVAWQNMTIDELRQELVTIKATTKAKVEIDATIKDIDSTTDVCDRATKYNELWENLKDMPSRRKTDKEDPRRDKP